MSSRSFPPFNSLLKSRDVEDPINVYVHRTLAYAFVRLVHRTSLTPNGITLLAMIVGLTAGVAWLVGTPVAMVIGGVLVWTSAILDGADGILARAKNMQSPFGRALDGVADLVVGIGTVVPGFIHLWVKHHDPMYLVFSVPIGVLTLFHVYLYDFYKESYLRMTRLDRGGEGEDIATTERRVSDLERDEHSPLLLRFIMKHLFLPFLKAQARVVARTNPAAYREGLRFPATPESARIYRRENLGPMRIWALISLAPHSYLIAICGIVDRLDIYFWIRLVVMNVLFVIVLLWQRRATARTLAELSDIGASPVPIAQGVGA